MKREYKKGDLLLIQDLRTQTKHLVIIEDITGNHNLSVSQYPHQNIDASFTLATNAIIHTDLKHEHNFTMIGVVAADSSANDQNPIVLHNIHEINEYNNSLSFGIAPQVTRQLNGDHFTLNDLNSFLSDSVFAKLITEKNENSIRTISFEELDSVFQIQNVSPLKYESHNPHIQYTIDVLNLNAQEHQQISVYSYMKQPQLVSSLIYLHNKGYSHHKDTELIYPFLEHLLENSTDRKFSQLQEYMQALTNPREFTSMYSALNPDNSSQIEVLETIQELINRAESITISNYAIDYHEGSSNYSGYYESLDTLQHALKSIYNERDFHEEHKAYIKITLSDSTSIEIKIKLGDNYGALNPYSEHLENYLSKGPRVVTSHSCKPQIVNRVFTQFAANNQTSLDLNDIPSGDPSKISANPLKETLSAGQFESILELIKDTESNYKLTEMLSTLYPNNTLNEQQVSIITNSGASMDKKVMILSLLNVPGVLDRVNTNNASIKVIDSNGKQLELYGGITHQKNVAKLNIAELESKNRLINQSSTQEKYLHYQKISENKNILRQLNKIESEENMNKSQNINPTL